MAEARIVAAMCVALATVVLALFLFGTAPTAADQSSVRVTTDSAEYCGVLAARLSAMPAAAREPARSLAEDGVRLCGSGHVRTGVAKLRRALRLAQPNP